MKKNAFLLAALILTSATIFMACSKEDTNSGNTTLHLRLTDQPIDLDSVFVDIQQVKVKMQGDSSNDGWISLNTNAGIYNLLELQNGVDTLLGVGIVPTGVLRQVRFILGTENRVVVSGVSHPLSIPSGAESGLKIMLNKNLAATMDSVLIDFDAALSVKNEGSSGYKLRPVLKVK